MIKLFRNIRQNFIMENKTSKYLKYAIGEIVLVVIGILIALQINNWNETKKEHHILRGHLETIVENLNNNQVQLIALIQHRQKSHALSTQMINAYKSNNNADSDTIIEAILSIVVERKFDPELSGFERLKSSTLYESQAINAIRDLAVEYNKIIEEIKFMEMRHNEFSENMENGLWKNGFYDNYWSFFRASFDFEKFGKPDAKIDLIEITNAYGELKGMFLRNEFVISKVMDFYQLLSTKGEEMKTMVNDYLTKTN